MEALADKKIWFMKWKLGPYTDYMGCMLLGNKRIAASQVSEPPEQESSTIVLR